MSGGVGQLVDPLPWDVGADQCRLDEVRLVLHRVELGVGLLRYDGV